MSVCVIGAGLSGLASACKIKIQDSSATVVVIADGCPSNTRIAGQRFRTRVSESNLTDKESFLQLLRSRNFGIQTAEMTLFATTAIQETRFWRGFEPRAINVDHDPLPGTDLPSWFGPQLGSPNPTGYGHGASVIKWFEGLAIKLGVKFLSGTVVSLNRLSSSITSIDVKVDSERTLRLTARNYVLAGGSIGGRMFESTNVKIQRSPQELAWEAGLGLTNSTMFMFHIMGNCNQSGRPKIGCFETDRLSGVKVFLPDGAGEYHDKDTSSLLQEHKAHYAFKEISRKFMKHGGVCRIEFPDQSSKTARVSHHYSHIAVETRDGASVVGASNLTAVGDAAGTGFWSGHQIRFPGVALANCLVGAEAVRAIMASRYLCSDLEIEEVPGCQGNRFELTQTDECGLKEMNTAYLLAMEFGDDPLQSVKEWIDALQTKIDISKAPSSLLEISLFTAQSCLEVYNGRSEPIVGYKGVQERIELL